MKARQFGPAPALAIAAALSATLMLDTSARASGAGELWELRLQLLQAGQPFGPEAVHRSCRPARERP